MLPIVNVDPNLLSRGKGYLKAVSSQDERRRNWPLSRELLVDSHLNGRRMVRVDGERNRKALHHGEGQRIFIHIRAVDPHTVRIDLNIDLLFSEADNWIKAAQEWERKDTK